jgi:hypothetical protein
MDKRIAALSTDPHVIDLVDRKASLFIDPRTGSILVDQGDGDDRMNGVVFSLSNGPLFVVESTDEDEHRLLLRYCDNDYSIGHSENRDELNRWSASANSFLKSKTKHLSTGSVQNGALGRTVLKPMPRNRS